jgi:hypothetical protein
VDRHLTTVEESRGYCIEKVLCRWSGIRKKKKKKKDGLRREEKERVVYAGEMCLTIAGGGKER